MTSNQDPLIQAASSGHCEIFRNLLQPDPSQVLQEANINSEQLLAAAAKKGHVSIVEYIIKLGVNLNDSEVRQALIEGRSLEIYKVVIPAGHMLNWRHEMTGGPLSWVGKDIPLAAYLLEHGADPNNELQFGGYMPIALAARTDNADMIELFIKHGANIDRSGALIVAAENGHLENVRRLVSHGANVDLIRSADTFVIKRISDEKSALHRAIKGGHEAVVILLLENGADRELEDPHGNTALDLAREMNSERLVQILEDHPT